MNIDLDSQMRYGDTEGLRNFLLHHQQIHSQIQTAIFARTGALLPSLLPSSAAEDAWIAVMRSTVSGQPAPSPHALIDWLQFHSDLHNQEYSALGQGQAPDLSVADFSKPDQFEDWMYAHQQLHDQLATFLGIV
jgi:hypothetical protein